MLRRLMVGLVAIALLAPAAAAAGSMTDFIPPFRVAGTNGYEVEMYAEAEAENARGVGPSVVLSIWNRDSQTTYVAPGHIDADGYAASFARLGYVDVHYEERKPRLVKDCRGRRQREGDGRFTGTIRFNGENDFTEADYPSLEAGQVSQYQSICWLVDEGGKGTRLDGLSGYGTVRAIANGKRGRIRFLAEAKYRQGSLLIYRSLQVFGPQGDFVRAPRLTSARITPPAPFHGSGSFHLKKGKGNGELGRWQGNLSVDFPGFRRFPLTVRPTLGVIKPGGCKVEGAHRRGPQVFCL